MRTLAAGICAVVFMVSGAARASDPLPVPAGPVVLTVEGAVERTNAEGEARFDRGMLQALGVATVKTSTVWTDGVKTFEGVPLKAVLDRIGARGTRLYARALNDYEIEIPLSDLRYNPLIAMSMDGQILTVRSRGPLWIVYPRDAHPALRNARQDARWIWQLTRLKVE